MGERFEDADGTSCAGEARVAVAPTKYARGFDGSGREVPDAYEVVELRGALERAYDTDAHLVTYVVEGATHQPRINKSGLATFPGRAATQVFFCDVDNAGHSPWTKALVDRAIEEEAALDVLRTAGIYHTAHGRRIVQPLARPIPVAEVEPYLRRWLLSLSAAGLAVDFACADWTRHFRLPHVRRSRKAYRSPNVALERMRPIALDPIELPLAELELEPRPRGRRATNAAPLAWAMEVPPHWQERVRELALAVRAVDTEWHSLFLALAGGLVRRGVPPEEVPALCRAISISAGDARTADREAAARTTVERLGRGERATGYRSLVDRWPVVAEALERALPSRVEARLAAQAAASPSAPPDALEASTRALEDCIRHAPDGVTLVSAECGLGKTAAAIRVAAERARTPYATMTAEAKRAPLHSKTAISVDKNALALQIAEDLRRDGTAVRRIFGPLSVLGDDGQPVCRYHEVARPLVAGGQSMQWELCRGRELQPCEHYEGCAARDGVEGPSDARVTVGPHPLVPSLDEAAGTTGLLVIDEPPPLLETVLLSEAELETAADELGSFDRAYGAAMAPALDIARAWLANGDLGDAGTLDHELRSRATVRTTRLLREAEAALGSPGDPVEYAASAPFPPGRRGAAPPLSFASVLRARSIRAEAEALGTASRVLRVLHQALSSEMRVISRLLEVGGERRIALTGLTSRMTRALRREGAVVILDANAELHVPVLTAVLGYEPRHHRFGARDGAPIARTLLKCRSATRRGWFRGHRLAIELGLASAVKALMAWVSEDEAAKKLAILTMRPVELALRHALRPDEGDVEREWRALRQDPKELARAPEALGPVLAGFPGEIVFGHYGAVRGLNAMADVDCLATLGDPWPNLGAVENEVAFLGDPEARDERAEALCRAELEQAHGRLRAVHRTRPGRALHVGCVLPSGSGWASGVEIRPMPTGRPRGASAMERAELATIVQALGGVRATARAIGCSRNLVAKQLEGDCAIDPERASRLRELARGWPPNP